MATVLQQDDEEQNKTAANGEEGTNQLLQSTASSSVGGGQASAAGQPKAPTSSGQYNDIGKYYEAGKDLAQKQQAQVVGGLQSGVQQAKQTLGSEVGQYQSGLDKYRATNASFAGRSLGDVDQGQFAQLLSNPGVEGFTSAQGYNQLQQKVGAVQGTASQAGRIQALRGLAGQGYSSGEQALDSTLLNRAERDTHALEQLRSQYSPNFAQSEFNAVQNQAQQARQSIVNQRAQVQDQARQWLASQGNTLQNQIKASEEAETAKARQRLQDETIYSSYQPSTGYMQPAQYEDYLGSLGLGANSVMASAALSPEQQRQITAYNALRALAGTGPQLQYQQAFMPAEEARYQALRNLAATKAAESQADNYNQATQTQAPTVQTTPSTIAAPAATTQPPRSWRSYYGVPDPLVQDNPGWRSTYGTNTQATNTNPYGTYRR